MASACLSKQRVEASGALTSRGSSGASPGANVWAVFATHKKPMGRGGGQVTPPTLSGWSCRAQMIGGFCSGGRLPPESLDHVNWHRGIAAAL